MVIISVAVLFASLILGYTGAAILNWSVEKGYWIGYAIVYGGIGLGALFFVSSIFRCLG